nr:hypothetical protein [Tanacetum cinerariifolium]
MKVEESHKVTFDESPPPNKLSPLVDDDVGEEEAIIMNTKLVNTNNEEDESIEVDEIVSIKESKNYPLDQVIGNFNQRTLRSQVKKHRIKWIFRNKLDENGIVSRNKARLIAQGYNQQEVIDYDETYASVAMLESSRILLDIACANDFKLYQMDVKSASLNGFLNEKEMLKKFRLEDSKPTKMPMSTEIKLTKDDEADSVDSSKYQENPKTTHLEPPKRIFTYIRGTSHLGLWYPKGTWIETIVYANSDHAGDYVDRKSTSGVYTFMGCCLTSWFAQKQTALAISTTEAEYVSTGKACQQALWMKQPLINYDVRLDDTTDPPYGDLYIVPTGRVMVPTGRVIVTTGRVIVTTGRLFTTLNRQKDLSKWDPTSGSDHDSDNASIHNEAINNHQQPNIQPQIITTVTNNNEKFPYLKKDAYERESKARTTLLQSILNDHIADFHYMDDAREIWNAVKARFGGNAKSKKMRKSMLKQEFLEFRISEAKGVHKVALTLKTKGGLEFLSFDDLYYKLKTLEMDIKGYNTFSSSQSTGLSHTAFVSTTSTNKKLSYGDSPNHSSTTTCYVPSNSKTGSHRTSNVIEDVLQSFVADTEPEQQLAYKDLEQIEKLNLEEMDLKWKMAMLFKVRSYKCQQRGHFARECKAKGGNDKQRYSSFKNQEIGRKEEDSKALVFVDTLVDWSNHENKSDEVIAAKEFGMIDGANSEEANTPDDAGDFALMGVTSEKLNADCETSRKDLQKKIDNHLVQTEKWKTSSKNLYRLIDSSMSVRTKVGLGFTDCISQKELGWDDYAFSVFTTTSKDVEGRPTFYRFAKTNSMKAMPPPLTADYTSLSDHIDLDESQMFYGTKSSTSNDSESVPNDFVSCDDSDKSSEDNAKPISVKKLPSFTCNSSEKTDHTSRTSCNKRGSFNKKACHLKKHVSSVSKLCFVYRSRAHMIKDCDFYEKQMANSTVGIWVGHVLIPQPAPTGNPMVKPVPTSQPEETSFLATENEGIFDSVCLRSMTGNKDRLDNFQAFHGGKVTFVDGEGRITGKGTIRTPTLDFENVNYVKELQQFNLFSISQICDKKNQVLFTDTECLVLSKDFKLLDDSIVVLTVPRKHNLYTIKLNDLCPRGNLACLVAHASFDECVKWHMRMAHVFFLDHKDETYSTLKSFINLVENQLNKKVKAIRCDNGTEFKNAQMIELYGTKGIRREYIRTACYVLNRVSVTSPHNKTPYALLTGKIPIVSHFKPFGCHVTILNTSDHLGKFDRKADEGYIIGYSASNKAYKVYNVPNKQVEETMNLCFLKDKPNVHGLGHECIQGTQPIDTPSDKVDDSPFLSADEIFQKELAKLKDQEQQVTTDAGELRTPAGVKYVLPSCIPVSTGIVPVPTGSLPVATGSVPVPAGDTTVPTDDVPFHTGNNTDLMFDGKPTTRFPCPSDLGNHNPLTGKYVIGTKWILKNKRDARGIVVRNKNILVAQGHRQEEGIDYDEVFALVARIEAIRLFLTFASYMGFLVYQMDVKSVFLYGKIEEEVYVTQTKGFVDPHHPMKKHGYKRGSIDKTLFLKKNNYDIILVQQRPDGICIHQDKYVQDIVHKFDLGNVRTATTPYEAPKPKSKSESDCPINVHLYRSMIGSLMYLTASRPDIMFAVSACSRHQITHTTSNLEAVKKIFKYLKGQPKLGLWYLKESPLVLAAYFDSGYVGANKDTKSTTGGCQFLGRRLILWQCKKQTIVATSSTKAEYVDAANCCGQVLWIQN